MARRTATVYDAVAAAPILPLIEQFRRYFGVGRVLGPVVCILAFILHTIWRLLEAFVPADSLDVALDVPYTEVSSLCSGAAAPAMLRREYAALARPPDRPPAPPPPPPASKSGAAADLSPVKVVATATVPSGVREPGNSVASVALRPQKHAGGRERQQALDSASTSQPQHNAAFDPPPRLRIETRAAAHSGPDGTIQATPTYYDAAQPEQASARSQWGSRSAVSPVAASVG